ncbi:hypothetical protein ACSVDM_05985 [Nocardia sp. JW2]|uniref:hypothetical protein n=1 Tax=Nocardia sp. JW2 TaxID=3450738 RepID=UPI003F426D5C
MTSPPTFRMTSAFPPTVESVIAWTAPGLRAITMPAIDTPNPTTPTKKLSTLAN